MGPVASAKVSRLPQQLRRQHERCCRHDQVDRPLLEARVATIRPAICDRLPLLRPARHADARAHLPFECHVCEPRSAGEMAWRRLRSGEECAGARRHPDTDRALPCLRLPRALAAAAAPPAGLCLRRRCCRRGQPDDGVGTVDTRDPASRGRRAAVGAGRADRSSDSELPSSTPFSHGRPLARCATPNETPTRASCAPTSYRSLQALQVR